MFLISMMCLGTFVALQQITRAALSIAIRDEGYHIMQEQAEQLLQGDYANFVATAADQTTYGTVKTSYLPSNLAAFTLPSDNNNLNARVKYTQRAVSVATTATTATLRVEVEWVWQKRKYLISTQLFRMK